MLFASFRGYRIASIPVDLAAGVLLAAIAIPEQIATARLAGMPPETGLYAFAAATLAFVLIGRNAYLSVGADSTIATIFAVTLAAIALPGSAEYVLLLGLVAVLVGALLVVIGIAKAEWISDLLSIPVTVGFLAGIAIQIVLSQLPPLLGITVAPTAAIPRLVAIVQALPQTNFVALGLGLGVLAIIVASKYVSPRAPGGIVGIVAAGAAVAFAHLQKKVALVEPLRGGLPSLRLPIPSDLHPRTVLPLAAVVAVVCVVQTVTVLRAFRSQKGIVDVSRDVAAVGAGSILAGLAGAFPVDASPPRTAIVFSAGGRSQIAALVAVALALIFLGFGSSLVAYIPESALAGVLVYVASHVFQLDKMLRILRESRLEIVLVVAAAALVVLLPINDGVLWSILLSLFYGVYVMLRPPSTVLVHVPNTTIWWPPHRQEKGEKVPGILVFSPAAPLYFMNARYIVERLLDAYATASPKPHLVVIEGSGVIDIDYTGAHLLKAALRSLQAANVTIAIARFSEQRALVAAERAGIVAEIGSDHIFKSAAEAVAALG